MKFMKIYAVFTSYRQSDSLTIAEALYKYLTSKGLRVFLDRHKMIDSIISLHKLKQIQELPQTIFWWQPMTFLIWWMQILNVLLMILMKKTKILFANMVQLFNIQR